MNFNRDSLSWTTQPNGDQRSEVTLVTSEMSSSERVLGYQAREVEVLVEKAKVGRERQGGTGGPHGSAR
jgi:hypothetical protein